MFKEFDQKYDITNTFSDLRETISVSDFSDSRTNFYNTEERHHLSYSDGNYHGWYQTLYDGTPDYSSPICDITFGMSSASSYIANYSVLQANDKMRIYEQMMSTLLGNRDATLEHIEINDKPTSVAEEGFFITFKRQKYVSHIASGSFRICMTILNKGTIEHFEGSDMCNMYEYEPYLAETYALRCSCPGGCTTAGEKNGIHLFYNAGVVFVPAGIFGNPNEGFAFSGSHTISDLITGSYIDNLVDGFRSQSSCLKIDGVTRQHSTLYNCRINDNDLKYSSNSTYVDTNGFMLLKSGSNASIVPEYGRNYITTVGIYDYQNNLLAVAKTNRPLKNELNRSIILTCRVDY